jgi:hypothetical protein
MRGQMHTMGGQTIATGGYVIDMNYFKTMRYEEGGEGGRERREEGGRGKRKEEVDGGCP